MIDYVYNGSNCLYPSFGNAEQLVGYKSSFLNSNALKI